MGSDATVAGGFQRSRRRLDAICSKQRQSNQEPGGNINMQSYVEHAATTTVVTDEPPSSSMLRKVAIASCIGSTVEWYDFFIYATASALVFNKLFFPQLSPLIGSLVALGTYAAGFVARPIGGLVFGIIGDRQGRKSALVWTLLMVGTATFLVGLLPTYDVIGAAGGKRRTRFLVAGLTVRLRPIQG
jgi:Sugar (and other) transporter